MGSHANAASAGEPPPGDFASGGIRDYYESDDTNYAETAPTDTCKRPAQILGVFLLVGGFFGGGLLGQMGRFGERVPSAQSRECS